MKQSPRNTVLILRADQTYLCTSDTKRSFASLSVTRSFDSKDMGPIWANEEKRKETVKNIFLELQLHEKY